MENQDAAAQLRDLQRVREVAVPGVPVWYWGALGMLFGVGVAAVSSGFAWAMVLAGVLVIAAGRVLAGVLGQRTGLRIGRVFGGATSWLIVPWFFAIAVLCVVGRMMDVRFDSSWPGVIAGVVVVLVTLIFGRAYDGARRRRVTGAGQ